MNTKNANLFQRFFSEPLLYFFLFGSLLYGYFELQSGDLSQELETIRITPSDVQKLNTRFEEKTGIKPTALTTQTLVEGDFIEQLLFEEAINLGLLKSDEIIKERLISKMKHILLNETPLIDPTEEQIHKYYKSNIKEYSHVESITFSHILLASHDLVEASRLLELLQSSKVPPDASESFSLPSIVPPRQKASSIDVIQELYGNFFTTKLLQTRSNRWAGPFISKFGLHLVYIEKKSSSLPIDFNEIEEQVYNDFMQDQKESNYNKALTKLAAQYRLEKE